MIWTPSWIQLAGPRLNSYHLTGVGIARSQPRVYLSWTRPAHPVSMMTSFHDEDQFPWWTVAAIHMPNVNTGYSLLGHAGLHKSQCIWELVSHSTRWAIYEAGSGEEANHLVPPEVTLWAAESQPESWCSLLLAFVGNLPPPSGIWSTL